MGPILSELYDFLSLHTGGNSPEKIADFKELETMELYPWEWLDYVDS